MTSHEHASSETIVVGHDGSAGADRALEIAFEWGEALAAPVLVVRTWLIDYPPAKLIEDGYVLPLDEVNAREQKSLIRHVRPLRDKHPSVPTEYRAVLGQPAEILVEIARHARVLVVGSRGRGGFAALMLGSVSEQCVHHATCPVLVVPRGQAGLDPSA